MGFFSVSGAGISLPERIPRLSVLSQTHDNRSTRTSVGTATSGEGQRFTKPLLSPSLDVIVVKLLRLVFTATQASSPNY